MLIGTVDVGAASIGVDREWAKEQRRFIGGNGVPRVYDAAPEAIMLKAQIPRMDSTTHDALVTYLRYTANYAANPITIVDDWSVAWTVRWWDGVIRTRERAGRYFDTTLTFRREP
jgi:hypothetical protein